MMDWIAPITDRTADDVRAAREALADRMAGGSAETVNLRGCIGAADLDRIESDTAYLAGALTGYGFPVSVVTRTWQRSDLPTSADVQRIIANVAALGGAFYRMQNAPELPAGIGTYADANAIEENLLGIWQLIAGMTASFRKCGTFRSGARRILPIKR